MIPGKNRVKSSALLSFSECVIFMCAFGENRNASGVPATHFANVDAEAIRRYV